MLRRAICVAAVILVGVVVSVVAPPCPIGSIATDSALISHPKIGDVVVEACLTRSGGNDTYTYYVTNLSAWPTEVCALLVSGLGVLKTDRTTSDLRWLSAVDDESSACSTLWTWSAGSSGSAIRPGDTGTFEIRLVGESAPATVQGKLGACGTEAVEFFSILGPSACDDVTDTASLRSCVCDGGCTTESACEGDGMRIEVLSGPATQVLPACEPSWIRHGFSGVTLSPPSARFRLTIDGTPVPMTLVEQCLPSYAPGEPNAAAFWCVQFPPDAFPVGTHTVVGEWEVFPTADDPDGWSFSRTVALEVIPCLIEPVLSSGLPDLRVTVGKPTCTCRWISKRDYECDVSVRVTVENTSATTPSAPTSVWLLADDERDFSAVPELEPGASFSTPLRLVLSYRYGTPPCPLELLAVVDYLDQVLESNEDNNDATAEVCCP